MSEATDSPGGGKDNQKVSLDGIRQILVHRAKARPERPRIALVLSGGGAKCSYQVGAVSAIEEMLEDSREQHPELGLDLNLIVGTSGGAINAVPIALGVSKNPDGRTLFQKTWQELDQREILRPSLLMRANLGIWFALLQIGIVLALLRLFPVSQERRRRLFVQVMFALAIGAIILAYCRFTPWELLGHNHFWHHLYLWCTFGIHTSAWILLATGLIWLIVTHFLNRTSSPQPFRPKPVGWVISVCLAMLPFLQFVTIFWFQKTLSGGQGLERTLAEKFPRMIDPTLESTGKPALDLAAAKTNSETLAMLGNEVFERRLWQRDLVITGNCITQTSKTLPNDIYFYARGQSPSSTAPKFGARGLDIAQHPTHLMDMVLGSGTIFPVFPPRTMHNFPGPGDQVELIDGGFSHNSPIEAAVLWGATHIILIEVNPEGRQLRNNFLENATTAFVHLHRQTQLVDMRSKQQVMVFTLAPEPPHMCVLDFSSNLIRASIERGYREAGGSLDSTEPGKQFRKELGEPVFTAVGK